MNKNSNTYIIAYASILVIVVAAALAVTSLSLKGRQAENVRVEKMQDILRSIGQGGAASEAVDKQAYVTEEYSKFIKEAYVVDNKGDEVAGVDAFAVFINLKAEYDKPAQERRLPVFVSLDSEGKSNYIFPLWGKGLWGPVWGYVALKEDLNSVIGVVFDHQGETPGLGAEITKDEFTGQFIGKTILKEGRVQSISLKKGNSGGDPYAVDALSGGTLTCIGVENMLKDGLTGYQPFIDRVLAAKVGASALEASGVSGVSEVSEVSGVSEQVAAPQTAR